MSKRKVFPIRNAKELEEAKKALFKHLVKCLCNGCDCTHYQKVKLIKQEARRVEGGGFAVTKKAEKREANARRWAIVSYP